nr:MAG TPA: Protein of unknown function (DUF551) [Caudoviricetes sp.]
MSRVRTRLEQYKAEIEKKSQYKHGLPGSALDIVNTLLDDLEQDEKENGWIPVSERLPDQDKYIAISLDNCDIPAIGRYTVDDEGGGTFRVGDQEESFLELNLVVNAWKPLPEPYKED